MNFNDQAKALRKQIRYLLQLNNSQDVSLELSNLMQAQNYLYQAIYAAMAMGMVSFDSQDTTFTPKGEN
jgi:hypothetical protein